MNDQTRIVENYQRMRAASFRLGNLIVQTIPKKTLDEAGKSLGFIRGGVLVFETEHEMSLLMDYCLYCPGSDGRNLVVKYIEKSPPPDGSDESVVLRGMTQAHYSLFQVVGVERGVGISVRDLLRGGVGFIVDVGLGTTAREKMLLASRVIPMDGYFMTGGAGLPVDLPAGEGIIRQLKRAGYDPESFDFSRITPQQEAEVAAMMIRECRSAGTSARIKYEDAGSKGQLPPAGPVRRRIGRNDPCPCGSGKKYKVCCNRDRY